MGLDSMGLNSIERRGDRAVCRKVGHPDRQTAEAVRIGLEIWNRATRGNRPDLRVVVFRCKKCKQLHVGCARQADNQPAPARARATQPAPGILRRGRPPRSSSRSDLDIRYLIEEFDIS